MPNKTCSKCGEVKSLDYFYKHKNGKDGIYCHCKHCVKEIVKNKYLTKIGVATMAYNNQIIKSKKREHQKPTYSRDEFTSWVLQHPLFETLYKQWEMSNYDKYLKPSIDRIDDYKGYSFDNIQLVTWDYNNNKGHKSRKNGINNKHSKAIIGVNIDDGSIIEFYSTHEASRQTGINQGNISQCCNGNKSYSHAGGYKWKYKNN